MQEEKPQDELKQVPENANDHCPGTQSSNAGKESGCDGCPNQQICATGALKQEDPQIPIINEKLASIKHKILVLSGKGGVGKSTVSSQLALRLSSMGYDVGLLDLDICGQRWLPSHQRRLVRSMAGWPNGNRHDGVGCGRDDIELVADDWAWWASDSPSHIAADSVHDRREWTNGRLVRRSTLKCALARALGAVLAHPICRLPTSNRSLAR